MQSALKHSWKLLGVRFAGGPLANELLDLAHDAPWQLAVARGEAWTLMPCWSDPESLCVDAGWIAYQKIEFRCAHTHSGGGLYGEEGAAQQSAGGLRWVEYHARGMAPFGDHPFPPVDGYELPYRELLGRLSAQAAR